MKRLLLASLLALTLAACTPPQGWHYEQIWTTLPDPSAHAPSWRAGHFLSCQVNDGTYVMRRCF